ncbi:hypothetical protein KEM63_04705 [Halopseudomonas nanhaiensis]|uniref:hotdog fold domain-containing protein n=1 Tax=Halopseudomonas nanhaiensis TaxID=2830842 RepID=UPI001CBA82DD|nr:hotdog fold domain-containing protein [Halopseudomonas nanhaiensis]UAW99274.1 hypothetical protein KEM63_04705 [Halopseudomonas nanhaiensis]
MSNENAAVAHSLTIASRFCGPPDSGNGGYVAGLLAREMSGQCQVTLHAPPPLDRPLSLVSAGDGLQLRDGDRLLASARPYQLVMDVPPPPTQDEASQAQQHFVGIVHHDLPGCFVCGPNREPCDGLRIFAGPLGAAQGNVAALWTPDATLTAADGYVASEYIWAALDCPGFFAVRPVSGLALLGRFAARLLVPVPAGDTLTVAGWALRHDGRKHQAGTALFRSDGALVAFAEATWISIPAR